MNPRRIPDAVPLAHPPGGRPPVLQPVPLHHLSDSMGNVVKGTAWGTIAENKWVKNVSADFYNATVRKREQRVNLSEDAVVVFNDTYELGATAPKFFKLLNWTSSTSSR